MTSVHDRTRALEAVERIVNRGGDDVVREVLGVLAPIYGRVEFADDGTIHAATAAEDDEALLRRIAVLVSAHVR